MTEENKPNTDCPKCGASTDGVMTWNILIDSQEPDSITHERHRTCPGCGGMVIIGYTTTKVY